MRNNVVFYLLLVLAFVYLAEAQSSQVVQSADRRTCRKFSRECDFEFLGFEGKVPTIRIGGPADIPLTTRIVSKDPTETLGVLNSNGITPEVIDFAGVALPITAFGDPPFTPSHAKPFPFPDGGSGIGHQTFTGNQLALAQGDCIRVFFSSFQLILGPRPRDVRNINARKKDFKCVVFFTK